MHCKLLVGGQLQLTPDNDSDRIKCCAAQCTSSLQRGKSANRFHGIAVRLGFFFIQQGMVETPTRDAAAS